MRNPEVLETPIMTNVMRNRINPAVVKNLQADVVDMKADLKKKQQDIDKIKLDIGEIN